MNGGSEFRKGWPVLLAAAAGNGGGLAALPIYSLSSFMAPLNAEFGWSRNEIGIAATIVTVGVFVTGPIVGRFFDHYGVWRLSAVSIALLALALAGLTLIGGSLLTLYAGYALLVVAGAATTSVAYTRVVNTWFDRSRGLALGITMTGSGVTAMAMPLILAAVIGAAGWQAGFLVCAVIALIPLPLVWLLLRERSVQAGDTPVPAAGLTTRETLRTWRFWTMVAAALIFSSAVGGLIVHIVPLLSDMGFSSADAARSAALLGVGIIAGRLLTGTLLDRFPGPLVAAALMTFTALGLLMLYGEWRTLAPLAVLIVGLALGSEGDILAYFVARYFGMRSYAELFGWLFGCIALGAAAGPLLIAALQNGDGYRTPLLVFAGQCIVAALLLGSLGRYRDREAAHATA